jgi:hypothetical protein
MDFEGRDGGRRSNRSECWRADRYRSRSESLHRHRVIHLGNAPPGLERGATDAAELGLRVRRCRESPGGPS